MTDVVKTRAIGGEGPATDITHAEAVEKELDNFIERRAKGNEISPANAREMLWKDSIRRHHASVRRKNRAAWYSHFCTMAENHAQISQDYQRRAEELCQEGAS